MTGPPSPFVFYRQHLGNGIFRSLCGRRGTRPGYYFPHLDINRFADHQVPIPDGARPTKRPSADWIRRCFYDPDRHRVRRVHKHQHDDDDVFWMHDNGGRPFLVYISRDETDRTDPAGVVRRHPSRVSVYRVADDAYMWDEDYQNHAALEDFYGQLVVQFDNSATVFIGVDIGDERQNGNSILVHTGDRDYVSVGSAVYGFTARDTIRKYYSNIGNNDVPYSVAIGDEHLYLDNAVVPIVLLYPEGRPHDDVLSDAHQRFYDMFFRAGVRLPARYKVDNMRVVQSRLW